MCYNATSAIVVRGAIDAVCSQDSDCLYSLCSDNVCAAPALLCPTAVSGTCIPLKYLYKCFRVSFLLFIYSSSQGLFVLETVRASMLIHQGTVSHPAPSLTFGAKHSVNAPTVSAGEIAHSTLSLKAGGTMSGTSITPRLISSVILL